MPRVYNLRCDKVPPGAVYVGRGKNSRWGNRYVIGRDGSRADVIRKFTEIQLPDLLPRIHLLRGKDLVCFCAPEDCHGDVLLTMANVSMNEGFPHTDRTFARFQNWPYIAGLLTEEVPDVDTRSFCRIELSRFGLLTNHGIDWSYTSPYGVEIIDGEERLLITSGSWFTELQAYTSAAFRDAVQGLLILGG